MFLNEYYPMHMREQRCSKQASLFWALFCFGREIIPSKMHFIFVESLKCFRRIAEEAGLDETEERRAIDAGGKVW